MSLLVRDVACFRLQRAGMCRGRQRQSRSVPTAEDCPLTAARRFLALEALEAELCQVYNQKSSQMGAVMTMEGRYIYFWKYSSDSQ